MLAEESGLLEDAEARVSGRERRDAQRGSEDLSADVG
jgi:hypothetical protein